MGHRLDTVEIRFFCVRSPRFWVSGYCTKWRIQSSFDSSYSRLLNVKSQHLPTKPIRSLDTFRYVRSMHLLQHKLCTRKTELALEVKFYIKYHWVTRSWWRTLTNGSDVKYVFPLTKGNEVRQNVFPRCRLVDAPQHVIHEPCRRRVLACRQEYSFQLRENEGNECKLYCLSRLRAWPLSYQSSQTSAGSDRSVAAILSLKIVLFTKYLELAKGVCSFRGLVNQKSCYTYRPHTLD